MQLFVFATASLAFVANGAEFLTKSNRTGQPDAMTEFAEKEKAAEYMDKWRGKSWESSRLSCDVDMLPKSTDSVIFNICGNKAADGDRCICNIAKAHSCHAGCRKVGKVCPKACHNPKCGWGAPGNGGSELDGGGNNGKCVKYCSPEYGGHRFCGAGPDYMTGMFVDCSGCAPGQRFEDMSSGEKKVAWSNCMADCFPTPSCQEMCGEGTKECYEKCVGNYKAVVEPYWEIFKGTLEAHPLEIHEPVSKESVQLTEEAGQEEKFKEIEGADMPKVMIGEKKKVEEVEEVHDEQYDEDEYDDDFSDEGDGDGEEEWVDPWADDDDDYYYEDGEEWDEDEYGDGDLNFRAKRVHAPRGAHDKHKVHSKQGGHEEVNFHAHRVHAPHAAHGKHKMHSALGGHKKTRHHRVRHHHGNGKRKRREDPWKYYAKSPKAAGAHPL